VFTGEPHVKTTLPPLHALTAVSLGLVSATVVSTGSLLSAGVLESSTVVALESSLVAVSALESGALESGALESGEDVVSAPLEVVGSASMLGCDVLSSQAVSNRPMARRVAIVVRMLLPPWLDPRCMESVSGAP